MAISRSEYLPMLDQEDLKWLASTVTGLNSLLQQIARYSDLAQRHKGEHNYLDLLGERVELGAKTAQALFDRVTSNILDQTAAKSTAPVGPQPSFTVMPPPVPSGSGTAAPSRSLTTAATAVKAGVNLPMVAESPQTTTAPEIEIRNPKGHRELILLVEDDFDVTEVAGEMLIDEGYKVIVARDGFEALQIYRNTGKQIGLVILDFFLPVMDGDAVFDELRELNPKINVVLSSGFAEQEKIGVMLNQGLRGFIPKPYSREKLLAQVRSTLDAARQKLQ